MNIRQFAKEVATTVKYGAPSNPTFPNSTGYTVTLRRKGKSLTVPFYMGSAHTKEPTALDVLSTLQLDASTYASSRGFEDWASDFGFGIANPKRIYSAVKRIHDKLETFYGNEFQSFLTAENDY